MLAFYWVRIGLFCLKLTCLALKTNAGELNRLHWYLLPDTRKVAPQKDIVPDYDSLWYNVWWGRNPNEMKKSQEREVEVKGKEMCLDTTTHKFKCVKITHICLIWDQTFSNLYLLPFNRRCRIYSGFHFFLSHSVPPFKHVTKFKCYINQQYLKTVDLHFAKSE